MSQTPMQKQFEEIKETYPDAILLFRLGDFYELLGDDAVKASKIMGITLTKRGKGENAKPMAGVPYHALGNYLPKLVDHGEKVVIVDQVGEVQPGKLVKREVTEIITPGAIIDEKLLTENKNNFLACIYVNESRKKHFVNVAMVDVGTGDVLALDLGEVDDHFEDLREFINKYQVKQIVLNEKAFERKKYIFTKNYFPSVEMFDPTNEGDFDIATASKDMAEKYKVNSLKAWGISSDSTLVGTINALGKYLHENLKKELNLSKLRLIRQREYVHIPWATYRALDIFTDNRGNKLNSLLHHLDLTRTPAGRRKLHSWLLNVLVDLGEIGYRQDSVEKMLELFLDNEKKLVIEDFLDHQPDYDRIATKKMYDRLSPNDLYALAQGVLSLQNFIKQNKTKGGVFDKLSKLELEKIAAYAEELVSAIVPGVNSISDPGFINPDYDGELMSIAEEASGGKDALKKIEQRESVRTGISSLKVKYNKVFGYYIEISKSNLDKVPSDYIRKQTLVNAERFITEELKKWEERVLNNHDIRLAKELEIFSKLVDGLSEHINTVNEMADVVAECDVLFSFAEVSHKLGYARPEIFPQKKDAISVDVSDLKHPVLAQRLGEEYVSNDFQISQSDRFHIITGPNMAGKSTYIRSIALMQIMAQIGCFVQATHPKLQLVDGIFTRVGASDNLAQNESTFMVEMLEMAYILKHASSQSLIILDEVGRGTSTYDGVSLAWAITEYISQKLKAICLFATHYHELTELEKTLEGVKNYYVEVIPREKLFFTHKVKQGSLNKSFGVAVAKMAGLEVGVIKRAGEVLKVLEQENDVKHLAKKDLNYNQLGFMDLSTEVEQISDDDKEKIKKYEQISRLDLNNLTPLEVVQKLSELLK